MWCSVLATAIAGPSLGKSPGKGLLRVNLAPLTVQPDCATRLVPLLFGCFQRPMAAQLLAIEEDVPSSIRRHGVTISLNRKAERSEPLECTDFVPSVTTTDGDLILASMPGTGGPTTHTVREGDARDLSWIETESIHLVCTSPPYGSLKEYPDQPGQLGNIPVYDEFLDELDEVWRECLRILVPGGRVACVVGDVCISRRRGGRHHVLPLSADIQVRARQLGFDNLTPIRWLKVANMKLEASRSSRYLGKPNLPNGIIKNDLEHILFFESFRGLSEANRGTRANVPHRDRRVHQVLLAYLG